jgi:hypothetical protein
MNDLYKKWDSDNYITHGQYEHLKRLFKRLNTNETFEDYLTNFQKVFNKMSIGSETLNSLNIKYTDYIKLTKYMEQNILLNEDEYNIISNFFTISEINNTLKRIIMTYNDLRMYDLRKLLRYNPYLSFNIMIDDKKNIPKNNVKILAYTNQFEYGIQESKSCLNKQMYYIRFYDMLILDYDNINYEQLIDILSKYSDNYLFRIYKTYKGFHVFVISHIITYNNCIEEAKLFESDLMYIIYSKYNGFNIRLTPKIGYNEIITHEFICDYGKGKMEESFIDILEIFDSLNKGHINLTLENSFYSSFITKIQSINSPKYLKNEMFIEHVLKNNEVNSDLIIALSEGFIDYLKKPQRFLYEHIENDTIYYIAIDMNTNTHYICYNNILMIDIDNKNKSVDEIMGSNKDAYVVYETTNGYHIFVLNKRFNHNTKETVEYMLKFNCDYKYIICSYIRGFCVRLNKKTSEEVKPLYKLIGYFNSELIDKNILNSVNDHIDLSNIFGNIVKY